MASCKHEIWIDLKEVRRILPAVSKDGHNPETNDELGWYMATHEPWTTPQPCKKIDWFAVCFSGLCLERREPNTFTPSAALPTPSHCLPTGFCCLFLFCHCHLQRQQPSFPPRSWAVCLCASLLAYKCAQCTETVAWLMEGKPSCCVWRWWKRERWQQQEQEGRQKGSGKGAVGEWGCPFCQSKMKSWGGGGQRFILFQQNGSHKPNLKPNHKPPGSIGWVGGGCWLVRHSRQLGIVKSDLQAGI